MYLEILKNLGPNEIRLLRLINNDPNLKNIWKNPNSYYDGQLIKKALQLNDDDYELMVLNLFRLKVCDSLKSSGNVITVGDIPVRADAGIDKIKLTIIGYNLIYNIKK